MTSAASTATRAGASLMHSRARRDQLVAFVLGLVLLVAALVLRPVVMGRREKIVQDPRSALKQGSLARLGVEFPRVTLGGFRGLLAMVLWQNAEEAKADRQWMRLETMYNYIGKLQPYFVTVYVYHSWNLAYNLSAQWHEDDSKYKWVLDGLNYLYDGEEFNPGSADLQLEIANIYFLKIGNSFERTFYRNHWRSDLARLHELEDTNLKANDASIALSRVKSFVTRPQFHLELREDPSRRGTARGYGIRIRDFDPANRDLVLDRPFGVSPFYFSYCEFKRVLANPSKPTSTGIAVVNAWPAMSLRLWCRDNLYYANDELNRLLLQPPEKITSLPNYGAKIAELRMCYDDIPIVAPRAQQEFKRHLSMYPWNRPVHGKHIKETDYYARLGAAERLTLEVLHGWLTNERKLTPDLRSQIEAAKARYREALVAWEEWMQAAFPGDLRLREELTKDFDAYRAGCQARIDGLQKFVDDLDAREPRKLDFGFLRAEVVER